MTWILLSFALGATLFQWSPWLPDIAWGLSVLPIALLWRWPGIRPLVALTAGLCWSLLHAHWIVQQRLPAELEGVDLLLQGEVVSLPTRGRGLIRFELRPTHLDSREHGAVIPAKVRLSWYNPRVRLEPGQHWRLMVRLKRPRGLKNPAGFDYEQWLFMHRIQATGYVRKGAQNRLLDEITEPFNLHRLRHGIAASIDRHLEQGPARGLIKALSLGDRRAIDETAWRTFSRTGTSHLIAISGLHIGLVAGWLWFLGQWLWRRSSRLTLVFPAQRAGALLGLAGALIYAALAGFSLPTQRALAMLTLVLGGVALALPVRPGRSLALALFLVVLIDPPAPLSAGFWLSFGAVGLILLVLGGRLRQAGRVAQLIRVQTAISLGLMPLLLIHFGEASLISLLANLVLVPWFALVLVPASLLGLLLLPLPQLAAPWYALLEVLAGQTFRLLQLMAEQPLASLQLAHLPLWIALAALLGASLMLLPRGLAVRTLGLLLISPLLFVSPPRPAPGEYRFTLLDVGQGLACVVETAQHLLVYDTGPAYASGSNAAKSTLVPYLARRRQRHIDRLVLSNGDSDHAGGALTLLNSYRVDDLLSGEPGQGYEARLCRAGESWSWDGVEFQVLHPQAGESFRDANNNSCVVRVSNGDWSLLLTGDIEVEGERSLLAQAGQVLESDILVAPHHGSATSSSEALVQAVSPSWVLFSTGYRNRYGFPRPSVVERWRRVGAEVINSADSGAVSFYVRAGTGPPEILRQREAGRRYWSE